MRTGVGKGERRRRQRGGVAIMVAVALPVLVGFTALAVDVGHVYLVRNQLQNAVDAAALAAAGVLDGTTGKLMQARLAAQRFGAEHGANGTPVALDPNVANVDGGDIVLGHWHVEGTPPWFEAAADPNVVPAWVNAVKVHATRAASTGNAVGAFLAQTLGVQAFDVGATAVAVGGGPSTACAFPIAIPDCVIQLGSSSSTLACTKQLTFNNDLTDNAGLTNLSTDPAVNPAIVRQLIEDARNGICHAPLAGKDISLQNGGDISPIAGAIRDWITANGGPITVTVPILQTGASGGCAVKFNRGMPVAGFAKVRILGVAPPGQGGNTITIEFDCNQSQVAPAGGGFYGDQATLIYLTK